MSTTSPSSPDYLRDEVKAAAPDLDLLADLLGGTRGMQGARRLADYIPPWPDESDTTWTKRTQAATLYEGLARTISASTGMLFQSPPVVTYPTDEARLTAHWLDVDGAGTKGDVFAKRFAESAITFGHALLVVDFPSAPAGKVVTAATEAQLNLRPRWAMYPRASILSWRTAVVRNRLTVVQVVLYEPATEDAGAFGVRHVKRYRVLRVVDGIARYEVWQKPDGAGETWQVVESGVFRNRRGETRDTLPIAVAYAGRTEAPLVSTPPLLGVAYANLSHWRNKTELQWGSRIAAIEQLVITGALAMDPQTLLPSTGVKIGWEHFIHLEAGGSAEWKGPSRAGLGELKLRVEEAEREMAALGMSFLSRDTRQAETAEAKRLDATAENSTLATAAQGIEDALNLAWSHHAWYEGLTDAQAPSLALNREFDKAAIDAALVAPLLAAGMPVRKAVEVLEYAGVLRFAGEDDREDTVLEWEAGSMAALDAQRTLPQAA